MNMQAVRNMNESPIIDAIDRKIIAATQQGLPLTATPYQDVAQQLAIDVKELLARMQRMTDLGIIRRTGIIPNHYKLGYTANGMSVWHVPEDKISQLGKAVGELEFVSHCYRRPQHQPLWSYNLFAMVHGMHRDEVYEKVEKISQLLGINDLGHDVLFSKQILKKTGLRIKQGKD
jgi:DNA-binding Lrp family transcriptional regulator